MSAGTPVQISIFGINVVICLLPKEENITLHATSLFKTLPFEPDLWLLFPLFGNYTSSLAITNHFIILNVALI